jgi:UDP:flavonoid glycosyltransferase YjiC (YdhE family)
VLVAPLDWGLGHATRCIPIITALSTIGCEVIIAAEGRQRELLQAEFPSLKIIHLTGYHVTYGRFAWSTAFGIILQIPKLLSAIRQEKKWLEELLKYQKVNLVVADNRYGLHNKKVPSVFITHQLLIKTGLGAFADNILQIANYRLIRRFSYCWVPDYKEYPNLAGELSHPSTLPLTSCAYIGALTRFTALPGPAKEKHLLVMLSGPEPQRTLLEEHLFSQLATYDKPVVILRGLPGADELPVVSNRRVTLYNHLPATEMAQVIASADIVICRSGYSSIMDLIPSGKKCVFIPTPGQPEQRYLADYLASKKYCLSYPQHRFSLAEMLEDLKSFQPSNPELPDLSLLKMIEATLSSLLASD